MGTELAEMFMPESMCARCGVNPPEFWEFFCYHGTAGVREDQSLGFCSNECLSAFSEGIKAAKELTVL